MIQLSEKAKEEVRKLLLKEGKPGFYLRVGVKVGGCSGLSYDFRLDNHVAENDKTYAVDDIQVVCDLKSFVYLHGMTVDYSNNLVGGGFKFVNPNAAGSCGCGTSFSV